MIKDHAVQSRKRRMATWLIQYGMRASIIAAIFDLPLGQARTLYQQVTGHTSPSGQKPRSDEYYFAPIMQMHASVFLMFYRRFARKGADPRAALVAAYAQYAKMCKGSPLMHVDRAWRLTALANQQDGIVREARCRSCGAYSIIQPYEGATRYKCPPCRGSIEVSQRLRGRSGRKKKT